MLECDRSFTGENLLKLLVACTLALASTTAVAQVSPTASPLVAPDQGGGAAGDRLDTNSTGTSGIEGRVGSFQLMLQNPPMAVDTSLTPPISVAQANRGFGVQHSFIGDTFGYVGLSAGIGYTLTSLVEVGGALAFSYVGGGTNTFEFEAEPFVKLNLGPAFHTGAINPFVLGGVALGVIAPPDSSQALIGFDIDPGVEWLFGGRWGVDFFIPMQIVVPTGGYGENVGFNIGIGYGLVGYL